MSWLHMIRYLKWKRKFRRASFPLVEWRSDSKIKVDFKINKMV